MALVDRKLTDYTELINPTDDAWLHLVEPTDISQSPQGSSYKVRKSVLTKIPAPYTTFKFIQKGYGNTDLINNEIGDIFCGWLNDGTIRYSEAIWNGGSKSDSDNFTPLVQTEI